MHPMRESKGGMDMTEESNLRESIRFEAERYAQYANRADCRFVAYVKIENGVASVALMDDDDLW